MNKILEQYEKNNITWAQCVKIMSHYYGDNKK